MNQEIELSIVIPVYNSEKTIAETVNRVSSVLSGKLAFEIILVNDGSRDSSTDICKKISYEKSNVIFINFSKNFGQHNALLAGYQYATGKYVLSMDDDLQTVPEEILTLYNEIRLKELDVVYAQYKKSKHSLFRKTGSIVNDKMAEILINKPSFLVASSFFIMKQFVKDEIVNYKGPYPYVLGLVLRCTQNIGNVMVEHSERKFGKSNYSFRKLIGLWLNGFTSFSVLPLRCASFFGFIVATIGFLFIVMLTIKKLFFAPDMAVGWTSTMAIILLLSGVQMISLGLIGEYLGRLFISSNNSPQYVIKELYKEGSTHI